MPQRMNKVYVEISEHPFYKYSKNDSLRFALGAASAGYSHCTKENNRWAREIWTYMYAGGPKPYSCNDFPAVCPQEEEERE